MKSKDQLINRKDFALIERLEAAAKVNANDRRSIIGLINWYGEHKSWTKKQRSFARLLVKKSEEKPVASKGFYLYAIGDGQAIKLGYSSDLKKRLKALQTAHPKTLRIYWRQYVADNETAARKAEKKLHRYCQNEKLRGEWFGHGVMQKVKRFRIERVKNAKELVELELVHEANNRI